MIEASDSIGEGTRIELELACVACRYNLQTLEVAGRCPECGESIEKSVRLRPLVDSARLWLLRWIVWFSCLAGATLISALAMMLLPESLFAFGFCAAFLNVSLMVCSVIGFVVYLCVQLYRGHLTRNEQRRAAIAIATLFAAIAAGLAAARVADQMVAFYSV